MNATLHPCLSPVRDSLFREDLRTLLPGAVLARPTEDTVDLHTWVLVAGSLEASVHALSCCQDGTHQAVVEVLLGYAARSAERACDALPDVRDVDVRGGEPRGRTKPDLLHSVERTWFRVAAQLVRPGPADLEELSAAVHQHRIALTALCAA